MPILDCFIIPIFVAIKLLSNLMVKTWGLKCARMGSSIMWLLTKNYLGIGFNLIGS